MLWGQNRLYAHIWQIAHGRTSATEMAREDPPCDSHSRRQRFDGRRPVPEQYEQPKGFAMQLCIDDPAEADRIFHAFAENGTVEMPLQKTFWSVRFGALVDQFGIPWAINCEQVPSVV